MCWFCRRIERGFQTFSSKQQACRFRSSQLASPTAPMRFRTVSPACWFRRGMPDAWLVHSEPICTMVNLAAAMEQRHAIGCFGSSVQKESGRLSTKSIWTCLKRRTFPYPTQGSPLHLESLQRRQGVGSDNRSKPPVSATDQTMSGNVPALRGENSQPCSVKTCYGRREGAGYGKLPNRRMTDVDVV